MSSALFADAGQEWAEDEVMLLLVCVSMTVFGIVTWCRWFAAVPRLGRGTAVKPPLVGAALLAFSVVAAVCWFWTAKEIRHGQPYAVLVMAMGGAFLAVGSGFFRWFGLSVREDACERRNPAAVAATCGGILGLALVYCGSITGEGPSFWNNAFSALLGMAAWFGLWLALAATSPLLRGVTEDRNLAAGLRLGAFLLAQGLVLGRALAGDWHSTTGTIVDFATAGWPALGLLGLTAITELGLSPSQANPDPDWISHGLPASAVQVGIALAWVLNLGWWQGAPH